MALLLCVGCGGSDSSEPKEKARIEKSIKDDLGRDGIYQLGDYYNRNGNEGVVIKIWNDGCNGMILSLNETECNWREAKQWCRNHGDGWRLPTKDELEAIYRNKRDINYGLTRCNGSKLQDSFYWSSTEHEYDSERAWRVNMLGGNTYDFSKFGNNYVRAVFDF